MQAEVGFAPDYIVGSAESPLSECESERPVGRVESEWGDEREGGRLRQEGVGGSLLGRGPRLAVRYCISQEWDLLLNSRVSLMPL